MKFFSTNYMDSFRCLGSDCEDTCCKNWTVNFDKPHYDALQRLGETHIELNDIISSHVVQLSSDDESAYARVDMDEQGFCRFLDKKQLCRIQSAGGFDALGNTCTFFPRVIYQIDDSLEIAGALSCPEVARLCLSSEKPEGLVEVSQDILPRDPDGAIINQISTQSGTTYERLFPLVRKYFLDQAFDSSLTAKQKMYLLCYSGERLSEQYHNDCDEQAEAIVHSQLERLANNDIKPNLLKHFYQFQDEEKLGLITIQSIFLVRSQHYQNEPLTPYIRDIINSYIIELEVENPFNTEIDGLYNVYHGRKKAIISSVRMQIEEYLSRHLQNCLLREWYIRFPDPFGYMLMLCIRQSMLRFLLYSHPSIYRWCVEDEEHDEAMLHKVIEELSVEMMFLFSRSIEHDTTFLQNIYSALNTEDMMNLDTALSLLRGI